MCCSVGGRVGGLHAKIAHSFFLVYRPCYDYFQSRFFIRSCSFGYRFA